MMETALSVSEIKQCIYTVRGHQIMMDSDLAKLYEVSPKRLNEQVRRNSERFPDDFMFQLLQSEHDSLRSQFATLNTKRGKHRKYLPLVFTREGIAMLSCVLKSNRAIEVNLAIMRAFVHFRKASEGNIRLTTKLEQLEEKFDDLKHEYTQQSKVLLQAIRSLKAEDYSQRSFRDVLPVRNYLGQEYLALETNSQVRVEEIQDAVAKAYGLRVADLKTSRRTGKIALARQVGMFLIRENMGIGYREIGIHFGGKDHSTVLYACNKIRADLEVNHKLRLAVESIQVLLI